MKSEAVRLGCSLLPLERVQEGKGSSREQGIGLEHLEPRKKD